MSNRPEEIPRRALADRDATTVLRGGQLNVFHHPQSRASILRSFPITVIVTSICLGCKLCLDGGLFHPADAIDAVSRPTPPPLSRISLPYLTPYQFPHDSHEETDFYILVTLLLAESHFCCDGSR